MTSFISFSQQKYPFLEKRQQRSQSFRVGVFLSPPVGRKLKQTNGQPIVINTAYPVYYVTYEVYGCGKLVLSVNGKKWWATELILFHHRFSRFGSLSLGIRHALMWNYCTLTNMFRRTLKNMLNYDYNILMKHCNCNTVSSIQTHRFAQLVQKPLTIDFLWYTYKLRLVVSDAFTHNSFSATPSFNLQSTERHNYGACHSVI